MVVCQALKNHSEIYKDMKHVGQGIQITTGTSFYLLFVSRLNDIIYKIPDTRYELKSYVPSDVHAVPFPFSTLGSCPGSFLSHKLLSSPYPPFSLAPS